MQRVLRDTHASQSAATALEQTVALIRQHFPPSIAHLYAIPRQGRDGVLEWWSELAGQPHLFATLDRDRQAALLERYNQRQAAVEQLAQELERRGQASASAALRTLIGPPDLNNLYSINDEPLVIRWGQVALVASPPPPAPPPVTEPPPAKPTPAPVTKVIAVERRPLRLWPGLLLGLLLALLYGLYLSWPDLYQRWQAYRQIAQVCTPGDTFEPSEFVVVLDTSGSMDTRIRVKREIDPWYMSLLAKIQIVEELMPSSVPARVTRMDMAKTSLTSVIENLDNSVAMRLVTFEGCGRPLDHGVFGQRQRAVLIDKVAALKARGGTALGDSLGAAALTMNGRDRDGVIVMFVDGRDSCGTSVCEVSEQIAQRQPRLRINVVNISAATGSNCAASNTGGRVYTANDAAAVAEALKQASREVSAGGCS